MVRVSKPAVFLETSALVRFLVGDDPKKAESVNTLMRRIDAGEIEPITSNIVFMELAYVLMRVYRQSQAHTLSRLSALQELRALRFVERTDTKVALQLWQESSIPYGDCLIALQVPEKAQLATFDTDFTKLPNLTLLDWSTVG